MLAVAPHETQPRWSDVAMGAIGVAFGLGPALLRRSIDQIAFARALLLNRCAPAHPALEQTPPSGLAPVVPLRPDPPIEAPPRTSPAAAAPAASGASLAIPSYDELAASQVIPLLDGLRAEELEAVRRYETAARGRRTVLSRIAQIQAG